MAGESPALQKSEPIQKLLMDAVEAAVAEDHDDISGLGQRLEAFDDRVGGGFDKLGEKYLGDQKGAFREQGVEFYF